MRFLPSLPLFALTLCPLLASAQTRIAGEHNLPTAATSDFKFKSIPAPVRGDVAAKATYQFIDGEADGNGGGLGKLHDGALPIEADDPARNFFFRGGEGGRLLVDLGEVKDVSQVATYSWHPGARGPQVYQVYASDGKAPGFVREPKRPADPTKAGWKLLGQVDTRPASGEAGGQYGVTVPIPSACQYLLFDVVATVPGNPNANTFFSELNVLERHPSAPLQAAHAAVKDFPIAGGKFHCYLDTNEAPELADWAEKELMPVVTLWYPKIAELLPSDGFNPPKRFSITFKEMNGVAYTAGTDVVGSKGWYSKNLHGEGIGSIVHELVHVMQQYRGRPRPPGWLIEGIPEYIRWYLYEPQTRGAEIAKSNVPTARYDASYRQNGNFLNWVIGKYPPDLLTKLNAACRTGAYTEDFWKTQTSHTAPELAEEWKKDLLAR